MNHRTVSNQYLGGIEAGGTKFLCTIVSADSPREIISEVRIPTTDPESTLREVIDFFQNSLPPAGLLSAIGIASFGPLGVNPALPTYGRILATPKLGWKNVDIIAPLKNAFSNQFSEIKFAIDTDVNAAALAEGLHGASVGLDSFVYITIGTGIGGGVVVNHQLLKGHLHPEVGHISVHREITDSFSGACPFHSSCIEGLASGEALFQRWGARAETLPSGHPAWELQAKYIASLCQTLTAVLSPQRIILGGGVMQQAHLLPLIRDQFHHKAGNYWELPDEYLVTSKLGNQAGMIGAIELAKNTQS